MKSVKKVELHLHVEGAAPPGLIRALAAEKHQDLGGIFDERGGYSYKGFKDFLRVYEAACSVLTTPRDYARLVSDVLAECAEQGAIHVELFVSPEFCGGADLSAWRDYLAAMEEVAGVAERQGISSRAVLTAIRHLGPDRARKTALCAAETMGPWVAGFGIGGGEDAGELPDFAWSFDCAREAGLGLTAHAGEWRGPESIRDALALGVTRIGHGIRAVEDPQLVRDLAERGITLEICPGSNVALGIVPSWSAHPIARLADAGVRVTVSTDDPPFFRTSLSHEYQRLADAFGWAEAEFRQMNLWAVDAAFCDETTKTRLRKELT
ncbi:adenosine deaminase [Paracoccus aminovorans]|uniref:Adenosine deaminase n=1 Tax=Paracoccus aminovorans TaxID=34004 RepID=A0A1I2X2J0_9RHOB|nr:adenosine deaminase [Paracoccus aminovorans]CQR85463.1 adenine deaminase [Paracoccus aminovorans]SFH07750.1 adenosine deaminase [Paracoccus aminovorans]